MRKTALLVIGLVALAAAAVPVAQAQPPRWWPYGGEYGEAVPGGEFFGFWILIALLIAAVVILVVLLLTRRRPDRRPPSRESRQESRAVEILKERYARGEISREEYLQMLKDLE